MRRLGNVDRPFRLFRHSKFFYAKAAESAIKASWL
jgi:hypothetical protein